MPNAAAQIVCIIPTEEIKLRHPEAWKKKHYYLLEPRIKIDTVCNMLFPHLRILTGVAVGYVKDSRLLVMRPVLSGAS